MDTPKASHELVNISDLTIDPRVQRKEGVHAGRAQQIADNLTPAALGAFTLSRRDNGSLIVLDGAHRGEACRLAGYAEPVHALVYEGLTLAQEAAVFNLLNTFRQPSFISRTLARVVAGDKEATRIVATIEHHGWAIGVDSDNGTFAALHAAERVYRNGAGALTAGAYPEVLDRAIGALTAAWRHDRESAHQMVVLGLGQLYARFSDGIDTGVLALKLAQERPYSIIGYAKALHSSQGGTTPAAFAKVVVGIYNKGRRRHLLPEWVWTR